MLSLTLRLCSVLLLVAASFVTGSVEEHISHSDPRALASEGRTEYRTTRGPELEGRLSLNNPDFALHLGGFCFGHTGDEEDREVAKIQASLVFDGEQDFTATGSLYLAFFDSRSDRWGEVRKNWQTSSCADKLKLATYIDFSDALNAHYRQMTYTKKGRIMQHSDTRDWHGVLLGCDIRPNATAARPTVAYEVVGLNGALSVFAASNFQPNSCPTTLVNWWKFAMVDGSFWTLISGFIAVYVLLLMLLLRQCRITRRKQPNTKKIPEDSGKATSYACDDATNDTEASVLPLPVGKSSESTDPLRTGSEKNNELRSE